MNYSIFTAKVIQNLGQSFFPNQITLTELIVQLPKISKSYPTIIMQVSIWGKLSYDVAKYYQSNDYIIIEGYITIKNSTMGSVENLIYKQVEISVFKLYPLLL